MIAHLVVGLVATGIILATPLTAGVSAERLILTMKVTADGLRVSGVEMPDRRMAIPRGTPVRLILEYADTNHNAHKFTLTSKNGEITSPEFLMARLARPSR